MNGTAVPSGKWVASPVPARAGVGLKARHYRTILDSLPDIGWFEVHAENYMGDGGSPHWHLEAIRAHYPLSIHGVGLSIGGDQPLDKGHLARLARLIGRYQPGLFSEHLAWSTHEAGFLNDLLPVPYNRETLARVCEHVSTVQDHIGRRMLLENPATYVRLADSEMGEIEFLREVASRTGCGLLLDVNNVFVSATNHGFDSEAYIDRFPATLVGEIHVAGHATDTDDLGNPLLIDAHDRAVADPVWALYRRALGRTGPVPTLVEWDTHVPDWPELAAEAKRAEVMLRNREPPGRAGHALAV
ncbi:MAG: DUF692 domain-containing protein [Aquisalimonadaceae bacterium]